MDGTSEDKLLKRKRRAEEAQTPKSTRKTKKARNTPGGAEDATPLRSAAAATPAGKPEKRVTGKDAQGTAASNTPKPKATPGQAIAEKHGNLDTKTATPQVNGTPSSANRRRGKRKNKQVGEEDAENLEDVADNETQKANAAGSGPDEENVQASAKAQDTKTDRPLQSEPGETAIIQVEQPAETPTAVVKKSRKKVAAPWNVSGPVGGCFLPQDPAFSADEKLLFLSTTYAVQVYSTQTSLLSRSLPVSSSGSTGRGRLAGFALSATNQNRLWMATTAGIISLWDWNTGGRVLRWDIGAQVRQIACVTRQDLPHDLLYTYEIDKGHVINVHLPPSGTEAAHTESKEIFRTSSPVVSFQLLMGGRVVIVACSNSIVIGRPTKNKWVSMEKLQYTWREFHMSKRITTFQGFIRPKLNQAEDDPRPVLDIALGDEEGVINVLEDVLTNLVALERNLSDEQKSTIQSESLKPRRLHWHRDAVGSVKWSKDGNYIISGGNETVLVIWQLATGLRQHLPHLTAAIETILVSPNGASYAVGLANNSVLVLSTAELEPTTNIVGLQSRRINLKQALLDSASTEVLHRVPLAIHPQDTNRIVLPVPSSQPRYEESNDSLSEPYIQTFDIANVLHVSRQAVTRNNATDFNVGPDKTKICEPTVKHMQLSHDGKWLATIDEWIPPQTDLVILDAGIPAFREEECSYRREVYLKFWRWDEENELWALDSRIDAPHSFGDVGAAARVLDLVAEPNEVGFATVGEDEFVRLWRPKTRLRNGVILRGAGDKGIVTWTLNHTIELGGKLDISSADSGLPVSVPSRNACLAFSADGSVLAAGVSRPEESDSGVIHIIATAEGSIRRSLTEIDAGSLARLALMDRYLIAVGDTVVVWDLVIDELVFCTSLESPGVTPAQRAAMVNLAVSETDGMFAVSCPALNSQKKGITKVLVLDPRRPEQLWSTAVEEFLLALVPAKAGKGFVALDATSSVRFLTPKTPAVQVPAPASLQPQIGELSATAADEDEEQDDEDEEMTEATSNPTLTAAERLLQEDAENDKPVVRPEQLQAVFDQQQGGGGGALRPVEELFNAVVDLYARKPRVRVRGPVVPVGSANAVVAV